MAIILWLEKGVTLHTEGVVTLRPPSEGTSERSLAVRRCRGDGWKERNQQNPVAQSWLHSFICTPLTFSSVGEDLFCNMCPAECSRQEGSKSCFVCCHLWVPHDLLWKALLKDQDWNVFSSQYSVSPHSPTPSAHITHTNVLTHSSFLVSRDRTEIYSVPQLIPESQEMQMDQMLQ